MPTDDEKFGSLEQDQVELLLWRYRDLSIPQIYTLLLMSETKFYAIQRETFKVLTGEGGKGEWENVKKRYESQLSQLTEEKVKNWKKVSLPTDEKEQKPKESKVEPKKHFNFGLLFFGFLVIMVAIGAYLLGQMGGRSPSQVSPLPTFTYTPTYTLPPTLQPTNMAAVVLINTVMPSFTPTTTIIPTDTQIPSTDTPEPTSTPPQPFTDNFDNGIGSVWTIITGSWITANGRLTITSQDYNWSWIGLTDFTPDNFILKFNLNDRGNIFVTVKKQDTKIIGFDLDVWGHNCLAFFQDNSSSCIVGNAPGLNTPANIQLEVNGNTYILSVNGIETQRFTLTTQTTTYIAIGMTGNGGGGGSPSFGNFSVKPLP